MQVELMVKMRKARKSRHSAWQSARMVAAKDYRQIRTGSVR